MDKIWNGPTSKGYDTYIMKDLKKVKDNLDPVEDFFYGINNVKDYHNSTNTVLGHMIYSYLEWVNGLFFKELVSCLTKIKIESMIDIGGCNGEVSRILLESIPSLKESIIVEPIPKNYHFIKFRFCEEPRIQICPKAVYYGQNTIRLYSENGNLGGFHESNTDGYEVPTITLEQFPVPDFLKLDIEGGEYNVIENSKMIKKVPFINIEFHDNTKIKCYEWQDYVSEHFPNHKIGLDGRDFLRGGDLSYHEQVLLIPKKYKLP